MADDALVPTQVFPPLPGMELPTHGQPAQLEESTRRTLAALGPQLSEADAAMMQLALTLARTVDRAAGAHNVRASSVAMAAKELRECLAILNPVDEEGPGGEAFDQLAAAVRKLAGS